MSFHPQQDLMSFDFNEDNSDIEEIGVSHLIHNESVDLFENISSEPEEQDESIYIDDEQEEIVTHTLPANNHRRRSTLEEVATIPLPQIVPPVCDCIQLHGTANEIIAEANLSEESKAQLEIFSTWEYDVLYDYLTDFGGIEMGETLCPLSLLLRLASLMEEMEITVLGAVQNLAEGTRTPLPAPAQVELEPALMENMPDPPLLADINEPALEEITIKETSSPPLGICIICMERVKECAIIPCGHISCCLECAESPLLRHCPNCRENIKELLRVYLT